jgi:hypothetical protein
VSFFFEGDLQSTAVIDEVIGVISVLKNKALFLVLKINTKFVEWQF